MLLFVWALIGIWGNTEGARMSAELGLFPVFPLILLDVYVFEGPISESISTYPGLSNNIGWLLLLAFLELIFARVAHPEYEDTESPPLLEQQVWTSSFLILFLLSVLIQCSILYSLEIDAVEIIIISICVALSLIAHSVALLWLTHSKPGKA
jgi:hypothetical protein